MQLQICTKITKTKDWVREASPVIAERLDVAKILSTELKMEILYASGLLVTVIHLYLESCWC
jgi:hypothetical protein